jgi:hypothetical protein
MPNPKIRIPGGYQKVTGNVHIVIKYSNNWLIRSSRDQKKSFFE